MKEHWSTLKKLIWLYATKLKGGAQAIIETITGTLPLVLQNALSHAILSLTRYGLCTQDGTPTPDAPVDIMTNNGAIKLRRPSGMPLGYQMVEWLKPAGAVTITGFKTKSTQEIETVFYRESRGSSYLYSSDTATSGTTNTTAYLTTAGGNWRWDGKVATINPAPGIKITSIQNEDGVWINGTQYGYYTEPGEFISTNDLRLSSGENTTVRIYSMTIREGETVTLDLVPVQRLSDSVYGFYDKVSGNFYTNDEATFEAGPVIDDPVEIYTDGTPEVLTVRGINLLDPSTSNIVIGEYVSADGSPAVGANNWRTDYIPIVGGKTYAFWGRKKEGNTISAYNRMNFYTEDKTHITPRPSITKNTPTVGTAPSNAAFVQLSSAPYNSSAAITRDTFDEFNWMFAEASTEIPFEPYVQPQTVTVPMLLGVGDYKDEAELIGGPLTHKIGIKVLTGYESYGKSGQSPTTVLSKCYTLVDKLGGGSVTDRFVYCTHLQSSHTLPAENARQGLALLGNNTGTAGGLETGYYVAFGVVEQYDTIGKFTDKLKADYAAGNPWILLYPLATETTEQTTAQHLATHQGTNIVDSTANVGPVEAKVEYYASANAALSTLLGVQTNVAPKDAQLMLNTLLGE